MDGEEHRPKRPTAAAGQGRRRRLRQPLRGRGGWGSAGVVLAPAMAPPRSADAVVREWWCLCVPAPLRPVHPCTWFWGRLAS
jgi:hypothetical protein